MCYVVLGCLEVVKMNSGRALLSVNYTSCPYPTIGLGGGLHLGKVAVGTMS